MLDKLKGKGLKCSIETSFFGQTEIEYLGFWVTRNGIKPINKKIEAITNMAPPTFRKKVIKLIGVINYYSDIRPRWSHTLDPLTKLMSIKIYFKWTQSEQDSFDKIKRIVSHDNLSTYPDFDEMFKIYTDASTFQLGAVVS